MTLATILIAADEPQFRRALRTTLASEGYFVVEATCGDDALLRLRDSRPDLILLDSSTSGIRDWDACREMRVASDAPLIMLSTRNSEWEKVLVLNAGADDYVIKPFGVQELLARIRAVLRRAGATEHPPTFECSVRSAANRPEPAGDRGHLDDVARTSFAEISEHRFCENNGAKQIGFNLSAKLFERWIFDRCDISVSSIVDKHVQPAECVRIVDVTASIACVSFVALSGLVGS